MRPLNGTKTHPLSDDAIAALRWLDHGPQARQALNPGVSNRLEREDLVETVMLPSPYASHRGRLIPFLKITAAGQSVLAEKS